MSGDVIKRILMRYKAIVAILVLILVGIAVYSLIPGTVKIVSNQPNFVVGIDSQRTIITGAESVLSINKGDHKIVISKDGYKTISQDVSVAPFLTKQLTADFKPNKIADDIYNAGGQVSIQLEGGSYGLLAYCDNRKDSICLDVDDATSEDALDFRNKILIMYQYDQDLPPVFFNDASRSMTVVGASNMAIVYSYLDDSIDRPVFIVDSLDSSLTIKDVEAILNRAIHNSSYSYYLLFSDENMRQYDTVSAESGYYSYTEHTQ